MKKQRLLGLLLAALMLLAVLQPAAFAAQNEASPTRTLLRVVANENGFGTHLETEDGVRYAAADPRTTAGGPKKAPENFPARYDSRDLGLVTSVKDQNASGICWAFAVVSCLETNAIKKGWADVNSVDYSESHLAWFGVNSATTNKNDPTYGDGEKANFNKVYQLGGNSFTAMATLSRGSGLALESDFNFLNDFLGFKLYKESDRYVSELHLGESKVLDCFEDRDRQTLMADIKRAVMEYGSVSASFYASAGDELFYQTSLEDSDTTVYYQNKTSDPDDADHMVTIVGWDDNFAVSNFNPKKRPNNPGAWIIKNSWGIGEQGLVPMPNGYLYLSYEDPSLCEIVTYDAMQKDAYDKLYQYDGFLYSASLTTEEEDHAAYANVFTAEEDGYLSKVGFYTSEGDQNVNVSVYHNLRDMENPENGDLVCTVRGDFLYEGYHTLDLSRLAALKKGDTFSVVVKAAPGTVLSVPLEVNYVGYNCYGSKDGQSFVYFDDDSRTGWYSAGELSNRNIFAGPLCTVCNVLVKAMALSSSRHTHAWSSDVTTIAASCTRDGGSVRTCAGCDALDYVSRVAATGHKDANNDGVCDSCGASMYLSNACPYCHQVHSGVLGRIVAFFHRILYFFRQLFHR